MSTAVDRIPKKVGGEKSLPRTQYEFWGIVAREERAAFRVLIYVLICASPNIVTSWFFFSWLFAWGHDGDLQNAAVPISLSMSLFAMLLASMRL